MSSPGRCAVTAAAPRPRRWTRALGLPVVIGVALALMTAITGKIRCTRVGVAGMDRGTAWVRVAGRRPGERPRAPGPRRLVGDPGRQRGNDAATASRQRALSAGPCGSPPFQRRAKVSTLVAATAAGVKRYPLIDVPEDLVWAVAAEASPWGGRQYLGGPLRVQLSAQPAYRLDAGRKLFAGGRGHRWAAARDGRNSL